MRGRAEGVAAGSAGAGPKNPRFDTTDSPRGPISKRLCDPTDEQYDAQPLGGIGVAAAAPDRRMMAGSSLPPGWICWMNIQSVVIRSVSQAAGIRG